MLLFLSLTCSISRREDACGAAIFLTQFFPGRSQDSTSEFAPEITGLIKNRNEITFYVRGVIGKQVSLV